MDKCAYNDCPNPPRKGKATCSEHRFESPSVPGYTRGGVQSDPPIVISGGSVTIDLDEDIFTPGGRNRRSNANKRITSVEVTLGGDAPTTFDVPNGKVVVRIYYGDS